MGMALSIAFDSIRKGVAVDLDELLGRVREGTLKELTLDDVTLADGTRIGPKTRRCSGSCCVVPRQRSSRR